MKKIIVIGGGAAGSKAASKAKRLDNNNEVILYTEENNIAYSLCGLPYFIEGSVKKIEDLIIRTKEDFEKIGIEVHLNEKVEKILPNKNCIIVNDREIKYDELILALGAFVDLSIIKNINSKNVFSLRDLNSAKEIKNLIKNDMKVVIIGGGYIAIELIEAFTKNNLKVVIIEKESEICNDFDEDFSKIIHATILNKLHDSVEFHLNETVEEINLNENNEFKNVKTTSGKIIEGDFCVIATGTKPNTNLAKDAGIKLGINNSIEVDNKMKTNYENIFACGDCAEKFCIITKQPTYIGLGTIANKEGRIAGINAVNNDNYETFDGILKSTITKFYDFSIAKTGLTLKDAEKYSEVISLKPISTTITKKDKAQYMPNSNLLTIKIVADKRSGEILGGQCIGNIGGVAQRINTITSVLKSRLTVEDLLHLDLAYAPPFSSSIDPIITAAYKLKEEINKK